MITGRMPRLSPSRYIHRPTNRSHAMICAHMNVSTLGSARNACQAGKVGFAAFGSSSPIRGSANTNQKTSVGATIQGDAMTLFVHHHFGAAIINVQNGDAPTKKTSMNINFMSDQYLLTDRCWRGH